MVSVDVKHHAYLLDKIGLNMVGSRSRSITRTPLTPPLSESELDEHLRRMKKLLLKISTTHGDRFCRQEARELMGIYISLICILFYSKLLFLSLIHI